MSHGVLSWGMAAERKCGLQTEGCQGESTVFVSLGPVPGGRGSAWVCPGCIRWLRAEADRVSQKADRPVSVGIPQKPRKARSGEDAQEKLIRQVVEPKDDWLFG